MLYEVITTRGATGRRRRPRPRLGHRALTTAWWHRPLFWGLLPVTAAQGLWLRNKALRLPGASGERAGVIGAGPDYHLLAIGDSIIDGVGTGTTAASLPVQFAQELATRRGLRVRWRISYNFV